MLGSGCSAFLARPVELMPEAAPEQAPAEAAESAAHAGEEAKADAEPASATGICSWYGPIFHGRKTASGEIFNKHLMTAAHRSLPFGTEVLVTDLDTDRTVRVRINDRGPYRYGRILDLSEAAGAELGIRKKGIAKVRIEVIGDAVAEIPPAMYSVQLGAFKYVGRAGKFAEAVAEKAGPGSYYVKDPGMLSRFYRVRLGPYERPEDVRAEARRLRGLGIDGLIVQEQDAYALLERRARSDDVEEEAATVTAQTASTNEPSSQAR